MATKHPGIILLEQFMRPLQLSQNALARAIDVPPRRINEIVQKKRGITADTAVRLGRYFENGASYWMQLQSDFDIELAARKLGRKLEAMQRPSATADIEVAVPTDPQSRPGKPSIGRRLMR